MINKRWCWLLPLMVLAACSKKPAMGEGELVSKYFTALGGRDKVASINTLVMTGTAHTNRYDGQFAIYQKAPAKRYQVITLSSGKFEQATDGEHGWRTNPLGTFPAQKDLDERLKRQALINPLLDYAGRGATLSSLGEKKLDDSLNCNVLRLVESDNDTTLYYFRPSDNLLIATATGPVQNYFSDFRDVEGRIFPFEIKTLSKGRLSSLLQVQDIQLNVEVPDSLFVQRARAQTTAPAQGN